MAQRSPALPQGQRGGRLLEALKAFNAPLQAPLLLDLQARHARARWCRWSRSTRSRRICRRRTSASSPSAATSPSIRYDIGLLAPSRRLVADPCKPARPTPRQRLPKSCRSEGRAAARRCRPRRSMRSCPPRRCCRRSARPRRGRPATPARASRSRWSTPASTPRTPTWPAASAAVRATGSTCTANMPGRSTAMATARRSPASCRGTGASGQTLGVAPQARWIAARIYNDRNVGRLSQLHRIMAWLLDPDGKPGHAPMRRRSCSTPGAWATGPASATTSSRATCAGCARPACTWCSPPATAGRWTTPASARPTTPAHWPSVRSTAAGQLALFSSRGVSACDARPYPDLMAPGELLRTTDLSAGGLPLTTMGTGTSYAAALVSGELALLTAGAARAGRRPSARRCCAPRPARPGRRCCARSACRRAASPERCMRSRASTPDRRRSLALLLGALAVGLAAAARSGHGGRRARRR